MQAWNNQGSPYMLEKFKINSTTKPVNSRSWFGSSGFTHTEKETIYKFKEQKSIVLHYHLKNRDMKGVYLFQ